MKKLSNYVSNGVIITYRVIMLIISFLFLVAIHYERYRVIDEKPWFHEFQFFTNITNYLVFFWLVFFFLWRTNDDKLDKLNGWVNGNISVALVVVAVVYHLLIAPTDNPEGLFRYSVVVHHYIIPPMFILDTLLTMRVKYKFKWAFSWLIYPILYLVYAMVIAQVRSYYVYFFLDLSKLTYAEFFGWIGVMLGAFLFVGLTFILLNRYVLYKPDNNSSMLKD